MNTYKTLTLYNKHSGDCRAIKTEAKPRQTNTVVIRKRIEETVGPSTTINTREMKKPRLGPGNLVQRSTEVEILEDGRSSVVKETGLKYLSNFIEEKFENIIGTFLKGTKREICLKAFKDT